MATDHSLLRGAAAQPDGPAVRTLHTLGPAGTNLESAAETWLARRGLARDVRLHRTLEEALPIIPRDGSHALVACAVYPELHTLVFQNLGRMQMIDSFILSTHEMVLAGRHPQPDLQHVATHPAPRALVPDGCSAYPALSNSAAARMCSDGDVDACVTTRVAARSYSLSVLQNYGEVPMAFTVHQVTNG